MSACGSGTQETLLQAEAINCDAAITRCRVEVDGTMVHLTLGRDVKVLPSFAIRAQFSSSETVEKVVTDFQMGSMDMGLNCYCLLHKVGEWQGTATLPACSVSRLDRIAVQECRRGEKTNPFTTQ